ncbi:MAG: histidine phosphatase family protein [Pseudomonadota bacterium]
MTITRWWWVRHGPTHETALTGWRDVPADLSDQAAIARLADFLPAPAILVSSDLLRARQTAGVLATGRTRLSDAPDLREMNFGAWDGLTFAAIDAQDSAHARAFWEKPGDIAPPGGESWNGLAARVDRAVKDLTRAHAGADIIAVAHMGVILTQIAAARKQRPAEALAQRIAPLSVSCIEIHPSGTARADPVNHAP